MTRAEIGQYHVGAVIAVSVGISVLMFALSVVFGAGLLLRDLIRLCFTVYLYFLLYDGSERVRWALAVLLTLGGGMGVIYALGFLPDLVGAVLMFAVAILYLGCAGMLLFSQEISAFLMYQRRGFPLHWEPERLPK